MQRGFSFHPSPSCKLNNFVPLCFLVLTYKLNLNKINKILP